MQPWKTVKPLRSGQPVWPPSWNVPYGTGSDPPPRYESLFGSPPHPDCDHGRSSLHPVDPELLRPVQLGVHLGAAVRGRDGELRVEPQAQGSPGPVKEVAADIGDGS